MSGATGSNKNNLNAQQQGTTTSTSKTAGSGATQAPHGSSTSTKTGTTRGTNLNLPTGPKTSTKGPSTTPSTVAGQSTFNTLANPTHTVATTLASANASNASTSASVSSAANAGASSPTATAAEEDMGYSTGALAGAIVGSIIGAAIITFLVTWLFFGKRSKRNQHAQRSVPDRSRSHRSSHGHGTPKVAGAAIAEKSSSSSGDSGLGWQAYLPQSADDKTVQRDVKTLFDQIELHVDNYYTRAHVKLDSAAREALSLCEANLPREASVEGLLENPQTTLPTIKHCIASILVARMSPGFEGGVSLLPAYLTSKPTKLTSSSMPPGESTAVQQAYSQLRLLNAYLHPDPEKDRSYQQNVEQAQREIGELLSTTFGAWQGPKENLEGLKQHEQGLVLRAADVGTLIMSQPSAYEFRWNASHSTPSRSFIVFPGFTKTTDERGRTLEQQQSLVLPVVARM